MVRKAQKSKKNEGLKTVDTGGGKKRRKKSAKPKKEIVTDESPVEQYRHPNEKRANNPPVGMVDPNNDPDQPSKRYSYDPRLDPQLQWSGKTENSEFDVDTVSLHVHERIDPLTIIEKVVKEHKQIQQSLFHYFEMPEMNPKFRDAIEFFKHDQNWSNRLIAGDSLLVMNSLLEKEGMEGKVQMIYVDPPYGIKYGSNFQPFVDKKNVKDGKDEDLTQEPEMIKAFRDTWELGIHSYLTYLRNRLLLAYKMLNETGSCFVQISDENLHHVREVMDDIFGQENFVSQITVKRASVMFDSKYLNNACFYIVWYAKNSKQLKYHDLFAEREIDSYAKNSGSHLWVEDENVCRKVTPDERKNLKTFLSQNPSLKLFSTLSINAQGTEKRDAFVFNKKKYFPPDGTQWKNSYEGLENLAKKNKLVVEGNTVRFKAYLEDYPVAPVNSLWIGVGPAPNKIYAVQTSPELVKRCILMSTDPGDLVFDPTCGAGTTAFVAEQWGRRWITCDTSRISTTLAKKWLMTSIFKWYELAQPKEGLKSGLKYKTVPHITSGSVANNETPPYEILYDQPVIDNSITRISGPFTMEAVPSPIVKSIDTLSDTESQYASQTKSSIQQAWRDELLRTGIRAKGDQRIEFSSVETHPTSKWIHAVAETKEEEPKRAAIAFGPEHAPLEQRQVERVFVESRNLEPKPKIIIFAAMQFDPEAAKDIDKKDYPGVILLKAEMNKDMQTQDLKKEQSTNESFWLMGSPDIECKKQKDGKYIVTVNGFDYYNTKTDEIESGGASKIAMWELDTDYDDRSVYPQQVFFPMEGKSGGWKKLAKTLQAYIDEDLITKYQGTESIPFEAGANKRVAVKIIDDRGIESLKIIDLE